MLVLSRKVGEVCVIGENISVTVLRVTGNQVRLGISAPTEIPVHRQEARNRLRAENPLPEQNLPVNGAAMTSC